MNKNIIKFICWLIVTSLTTLSLTVACPDDIDPAEKKIIYVNTLADKKTLFPTAQEIKDAQHSIRLLEDKSEYIIIINNILYVISTESLISKTILSSKNRITDDMNDKENDIFESIKNITKLKHLYVTNQPFYYYGLYYKISANTHYKEKYLELIDVEVSKFTKISDGDIIGTNSALKLIPDNKYLSFFYAYPSDQSLSSCGFIKTVILPLKEMLGRYIRENLDTFGSQNKIFEIFGEESDITSLIFSKIDTE